MMNAPTPSTIQLLRERDGDECWLCGSTLSFTAPPNSKKAATKEHLLAVSLGGTGALENLVLCHPGCNRYLKDRPVAAKLKMREQRIAARAKLASATKPVKAAAAKEVSDATAAKPVPKVVPIEPTMAPPVASVAKAGPVKLPAPPKSKPPGVTPAPDWQRVAMIATASATFFAGLCLGMLIG